MNKIELVKKISNWKQVVIIPNLKYPVYYDSDTLQEACEAL